MAPKAPVVPVPLTAPRTGLLAVAPTIDDPDLRWVDGFEWAPEGGNLSGVSAVSCLGSTDSRTPGSPAAVASNDPVYVWASEECSTIGYARRDWIGRVQRALLAEQSYRIALELWAGAENTQHSLGNGQLASPTADNVFYSKAPEDGFACMDGLLTARLRNRQGMIHVTPGLLATLWHLNAVYRDGGMWMSPNQNIVVADAGYTGTGPQGEYVTTDQWMYGTDMIRLRLGPVETFPASLDDQQVLAAYVDRQTNDLEVWAGRFIGVEWDQIVHLAGQVTTDMCVDAAPAS